MYKLWAALILSAWAAWGFAIANVTSPAISAAAYNGSVYLYYVGMANATAPGIEGVIVGPPQRPAPLPPSPAFTAGPYLRLLDNGSLALLWTSIELGPIPAAVLKMSVLGRGGWGPPALLTANGTVFNYASDGRYIYALWSPLFSPVPINATVLMFSADGALLRSAPTPGARFIAGAWNGTVVLGLYNGTYELLDLWTGSVEPLGRFALAGAAGPYLFAYSNSTLTVWNKTAELRLRVPALAAAFVVLNGVPLVVAVNGTQSGYAFIVYSLGGAQIMECASAERPLSFAAALLGDRLYLFWVAANGTLLGCSSRLAFSAAPPPSTRPASPALWIISALAVVALGAAIAALKSKQRDSRA